jgi:hypothetical protein
MQATLSGYSPRLPNPNGDFESYGATDGSKTIRYTAYYERNPFYRTKAIEIHGLNCMVCGINLRSSTEDWEPGLSMFTTTSPCPRLDLPKSILVRI